MRSEFEQILDKLILEKNKKRLTLEQIGKEVKLSRPTLTDIFSIKGRGKCKIGNVLKVIDYIEKMEVK